MPTPTTYAGQHLVTSDTAARLKGELPYLGGGAYREVCDLGDAVLKLARDSRLAKGANLTEARVWENVQGTEDEKSFAAVFACAEDGSWLVMQKAEKGTLNNIYNPANSYSDTSPGWQREKEEIARVRPIFGDLPKRYNFDGDLHGGNVGYPYWRKPANAAKKLMDLIQGDRQYYGMKTLNKETRPDATPEALKAALSPIKAFCTRQGIDKDSIISA